MIKVRVPSGGGIYVDVEVDDCSDISCTFEDGYLYIKWSDPEDVYYRSHKDSPESKGSMIMKWLGTKLLVNEENAPVDQEDGTLLVDNRTRDKFKEEGYKFGPVEGGKVYHFALFPYSQRLRHTNSDENKFDGSVGYLQRFYDEDKLLKSEWVDEGNVPYPPVVEDDETGHKFDRWEPEIDEVTKNQDYYVVRKHIVTYWNEDGSQELYKEHVSNGASAVYEAQPSKDSSASENFAFSGWSTTANGKAEPTIRDNITADINLYASYESSPRSYEVRFISEGKSVQTSQVEYGKYATFTGTLTADESGRHDFDKWDKDPAQTQIVTNTDFNAVFKHRVDYYDTQTHVFSSEQVSDGQNAVNIPSPTKEKTAEFTYEFGYFADQYFAPIEDSFAGTQTTSLENIVTDVDVYAVFKAIRNKYDVNFYNGDVLYDTVSVPYGSNAVLSKANPTKAQTVSEVFTFSGWSSSNGGSVEANILNNITSTKNVYAVYVSEARKYSITWDIEGTQTTEQVAYGTTPSHVIPEKVHYSSHWEPTPYPVDKDQKYTAVYVALEHEVTVNYNGTQVKFYVQEGQKPDLTQYEITDSTGHEFDHWDKTVVEVTAPTEYTAIYKVKVDFYNGEDYLGQKQCSIGGSVEWDLELPNGPYEPPVNPETHEINLTWDGIAKMVDDGSYVNKLSIGDWKIVDYGDEGIIKYEIGAINKDMYGEDNSKVAPITWLPTDTLKNTTWWNDDYPPYSGFYGNTDGGYPAAPINQYLKETIFPLLDSSEDSPKDFIIPVTKMTTNNDYLEPERLETYDNLWLLSVHEIDLEGDAQDISESTGVTYFEIFDSKEARIARMKNSRGGDGTWLRSPVGNEMAGMVYPDGSIMSTYTAYWLAVFPAFCTGGKTVKAVTLE